MYHQQQSPSQRSSASRSSAASSQNSQGYSSSSSNYSSQSQSGGFSSGGNQGYSSQQYQGQQQVVPPPPLPPMSVQQSPAPKPLHGILKTESSSHHQPVKEPVSPSGAGEERVNTEKTSDEGADSDAKQRPPWMKKNKLQKVNKTVKRRRQNARLRKLVQPKNAIMVLNEIVSGVRFTMQDHMNALGQTTYQVNTEIDGKVYTGQAMSKMVAKQVAAENALKAIFIDKISKSHLTDASEENNGGASDGEDADKDMDISGEVPWKSLTSFAIYKLFMEWQNEGFPVPVVGTSQKPGPQTPKPMKQLPPNPTEQHPVMLLNHMRPNCEFIEVSRTGNPPDMWFTLQVMVDDKSYTGKGKSKKEAKKEAAKAALSGAFDIEYPS